MHFLPQSERSFTQSSAEIITQFLARDVLENSGKIITIFWLRHEKTSTFQRKKSVLKISEDQYFSVSSVLKINNKFKTRFAYSKTENTDEHGLYKYKTDYNGFSAELTL